MEYGVIGEHLRHSFSPEIHRCIGDYDYCIREMSPEEVPAFLKARDFRGINVTIPYKQLVMPHLDEISEEARRIGAVNTVVNRNGRLYGYNTDFGGLTMLIRRTGFDPKGHKVLVLGSGGTSHTAVAVLTAMGAAEILVVSREPRAGQITYEDAVAHHGDAAMLLNTTPCGMFPRLEGMAVDPAAFPQLKAVVDAVYNPLRTAFVQKAEAGGIPAVTGLFMLVYQAILAAEHFFDKPIPPERAEAIYREVRRSKENIVLTGMPASGKSTVGEAVAKVLARPFFDLDEEIVKDAGCDIPTLFATEGEAAFRDRESRVLREQLAGKTGCVIATGGGAILRDENVRLLRQNGRLYFLDRPVELLCPTGDRPTASSREAIQKRYEERYPLYCRHNDVRIPAAGTVEEVVRMVKEEFML